MGYGFYIIDGMKRGYNVSCKCYKRGCRKRIDRGLSYLCYGCANYFCGEHMTYAYDKNEEPIESECFAGGGHQVCHKCCKELEV